MRRATSSRIISSSITIYFYPRSPCGERPSLLNTQQRHFAFLSTLSLRRATHAPNHTPCRCNISIHALLAESDYSGCSALNSLLYFYPRSPCGERPSSVRLSESGSTFLSTLSLRRATKGQSNRAGIGEHFYPRSPCGERPTAQQPRTPKQPISIHALLAESDLYTAICCEPPIPISIHALLAESDSSFCQADSHGWHFYPRSPCGERRAGCGDVTGGQQISIHALLAESDIQPHQGPEQHPISIHALLAESDQQKCGDRKAYVDFYPRSPCGERRGIKSSVAAILAISIHALLAESDVTTYDILIRIEKFLSTLSLRRATQ